MPEGPEIRREADKIAAVLVGHTIESVGFGIRRLRRFENMLAGHEVTAVDTRGKAMLTRFDNGLTIYSHNQLYGRWYTVRRPRMPKTNRQLRIELSTSSHKALLYSASDIDVLDKRGLASHPFLRRIGPDILDRDMTPAVIMQRLRRPEFCNRALGNLYLDQAFLAGNGNYLRSEILWVARIEPSRKPTSLSIAELKRLARETIRIARRSYRTRGVTVAPSVVRRLKSEGLGFPEHRFYVFAREDQPCRHCGSRIKRRTMASRNLFVCPACQPSTG